MMRQMAHMGLEVQAFLEALDNAQHLAATRGDAPVSSSNSSVNLTYFDD